MDNTAINIACRKNNFKKALFFNLKRYTFIHLLFNNQVLELGTKLSQDKNNCNLAGMYLCLQCVLGRSEQWMEDGLI